MRSPLTLAVVASLAVLLGSGCPEANPRQSLSLHGQLQPTGITQLTAPVHLTMVWYPTYFGTEVGRPPVVGEVGSTSYQGQLPIDFTFQLHAPPPATAMSGLGATGGAGEEAYGMLVAFEDGNGNGTLDLGTSAAPSPDRIIGVSDGDPSLPPPLHHTYVAYLKGTQGDQDYLWSFQMEQGYTLFQAHSDYGVRIAPAGTTADIEVTDTDALQVYGCAEADFTQGLRTACGFDPYAGDYHITGALYEYKPASFGIADGLGSRGDATILLNGVPLSYDASVAAYTGDRPVVGANTLQLDVPGYATEVISVTVPAPVQLTTPLPATSLIGTKLTVAWSDDPAIELYDVIVYDPDFRYVFHENFNENSFTTAPVTAQGDVSVRIYGLAPLAFGQNGHWVRPVSRAAADITFQ
jgi:hypothetical protein